MLCVYIYTLAKRYCSTWHQRFFENHVVANEPNLLRYFCSKYFEPETRRGWCRCSCLKNEGCALFTRKPHALVMPRIRGQAEGFEIFEWGSVDTRHILWPHQKVHVGRRVNPLRFACPCDERSAHTTWVVTLISRSSNSMWKLNGRRNAKRGSLWTSY